MATFIQIHALTSYPASNLNRDDSGRPKTMMYGGSERLRISSQSMKRAIRTSPTFRTSLDGALGTRAQSFGRLLETILIERNGLDRLNAARRAAELIAHDRLGKLKLGDLTDPKKSPKPEDINKIGSDTEQLAFLGPDEIGRLKALADVLAAGGELSEKDAMVLVQRPRAADIALFGRMLADNPSFNVEAACQIAHAFTTHRAAVEDDYFTAVDELKAARNDADKGAGFVGVQEFGSGTFYLYVCLSADELVRNLAGDRDLASKAAGALVEAIAKTSPSGKQNSFASRGRAHWMLVETGKQQPRTLGTAFEHAVRPRDTNSIVRSSINRLLEVRRGFERVYGKDWDHEASFDVDAEIDGAKVDGVLADVKAHAERAVQEVAHG
jgi:CRISPR system Cascade subunit CasC